MREPSKRRRTWTLLTGHGHVLVAIARNPEARIRDISPVVGLTVRFVQAIVADLEAAGYLTRTRIGRRVVYAVNRDSLFRHAAQEGLRVGPFLDLLAEAESTSGRDDRSDPPTTTTSRGATASALPAQWPGIPRRARFVPGAGARATGRFEKYFNMRNGPWCNAPAHVSTTAATRSSITASVDEPV